MGLGSLAPYMASKEYFQNKESEGDAAKEMERASAAATEFYSQTALVAASLGVVLDLFLLPSQPMCLEIMSSFSILTGGDMWLYETASDTLLTQDLFRHLSTLHSQKCLMRVRLPAALKVSKAYGRLMKDPLYDDLYHILCCDPYETYILDLEHVDVLTENVTLQVAFQYDVAVLGKTEEGEMHFEMQKRLRIATVQIGVSMKPMEIYESIKSEVIVAFLLHKVLVAIKAEGTMRAAVLLQDWLIILAASYIRDAQGTAFKSFVESEFFQSLIRLVYGLLRSALLLGKYITKNDDRSVYLQHLWQSLPPRDLQRAIYPALMSFSSLDDKESAHHSLSRVAMKITQAPGFLMDAYESVILFFTRASTMPCPPTPSCGIRQLVKELRDGRKRLPRYLTIKEDDPAAEIFLEKLLDEPKQLKEPVEGESGVAFNGYLQFVDWIKYASEDYQKR